MSSDSDIALAFKAKREFIQEKKLSNIEFSTKQLTDAGVEFKSMLDGVHLIVTQLSGGIADFWPSTGLWIVRAKNRRRRGFKSLIEWSKK